MVPPPLHYSARSIIALRHHRRHTPPPLLPPLHWAGPALGQAEPLGELSRTSAMVLQLNLRVGVPMDVKNNGTQGT
jgi:hypothetical protein